MREFQTHHGIGADGVVGAKTLAEVNVSANHCRPVARESRTAALGVAERTPRFLAVNIAGYQVYYFDDDKVQWTARAMVGKPYRKTPIFRADMTYLVINPDWTVPPESCATTSCRRQARPRLSRQAGHGRGRSRRPGRRPGNHRLGKRHAEDFPYMLRQRPAGRMRSAASSSYFRTSTSCSCTIRPSRELFARDERAFSSGCIRVENPFELAEFLLRSDPKWTRESLERAVADEKW